MMDRTISWEMLEFIRNNPTAYHTAASVRQVLLENGFTELLESRLWDIHPGQGYFVSRGGSSIIAFRIGEKLEKNYSFNIVAAHTDSPSFKLKENCEIHMGDKYTKLNTEGYGGMICSSWMDRPLSVAGRVMVKGSDDTVTARLVNIDRDLLMIPNVAIHMNRNVNEGQLFNLQVDMISLFGEGTEEGALRQLIANELGVGKDDILGSDLYLYSRQPGTIWGCNQEFISCSRLDDQQCLFAGLKAFLQGSNEKSVNILACFDHEEVGSYTKQGAASTFLHDVTRRINIRLGSDEPDYFRAVASSFMISADNAHAVHPNHPELTDQNNNVYMNQGVVVKAHAGQKYTTDGLAVAIIKELASRADVPLQYFANRSDKRGGSTLGNIAMVQTSMNCVDIGLPQLAMHSSYETAGVKDTGYMIRLLLEFFNSHIQETALGTMIIEKHQ